MEKTNRLVSKAAALENFLDSVAVHPQDLSLSIAINEGDCEYCDKDPAACISRGYCAAIITSDSVDGWRAIEDKIQLLKHQCGERG